MYNFIDQTARFCLLSFWATQEETQAFFHLALGKHYGYTPGIDISIQHRSSVLSRVITAHSFMQPHRIRL